MSTTKEPGLRDIACGCDHKWVEYAACVVRNLLQFNCNRLQRYLDHESYALCEKYNQEWKLCFSTGRCKIGWSQTWISGRRTSGSPISIIWITACQCILRTRFAKFAIAMLKSWSLPLTAYRPGCGRNISVNFALASDHDWTSYLLPRAGILITVHNKYLLWSSDHTKN